MTKRFGIDPHSGYLGDQAYDTLEEASPEILSFIEGFYIALSAPREKAMCVTWANMAPRGDESRSSIEGIKQKSVALSVIFHRYR